MGFRRKGKDLARDARRWHSFREANQHLFEDAGLASYVYESDDVFDDFLMHGYVDHHPSPYPFDVRAQVRILREIVVRYFAAGYADPGIIIFDVQEREAIEQEAARRLADAGPAG
jgi:hypothetical protein